jgi:hypothetical protein
LQKRGGSAPARDVTRFCFNVPAFAAVGFVALIGWAAIGAMLAVGALGLLGASIALVFHGFAVSLVAVQRMLSVDSRFNGSAFGAFLLGSVIPIVGCAWARVRASPLAMRTVGLSAIVGIFLHDLWFVGSAAPDLAARAALLAIIAMAGVSVGLTPLLDRRLSPRTHSLRTDGRSP